MEEQKTTLQQRLAEAKEPDFQSYVPEILAANNEEGRTRLLQILDEKAPVLHDRLPAQVMELLKIRNPQQMPGEQDLKQMFDDWQKDNILEEYGNYVYYPWNNRLVHLLGEKEFVELRTSRNKYKITPEEQEELSNKAIGIIGLSVGQSVAMTLATERSFGVLRLADYDELDLSNLNRIRSGVHNLGLEKCLMVAREIAEIDPYLKIELYRNGATPDNLEGFMTKGGKLDLLIEECDSLAIKILAREMARDMGVAVLMDTSDKGMLDVERFDNDDKLPLLHGKCTVNGVGELQSLNPQQQRELMMSMVDFPNISDRLKYSYSEIGKSLTTWPQLASSVVLGGGATAHVARQLLLGANVKSGRYYVDPDQICGISSEQR